MGGFLYGYDTGFIGGVLTLASFRDSFHLTVAQLADQEGTIVTMLQAGAFFGSLFGSLAADKLGRRLSIIMGGSVFLIGSVMQTASSGIMGVLLAGRVIGGFGVGLCSTLAPLYTSECASRAIRGRLTGLYQFFIQLGLLLSFWINYGLSIHYSSVPAQWQIPMALQIIPGLILVLGMLFMQESPRYLAKIGRYNEAYVALTKTRHLPIDDSYY
jgi:MFS family permease